VYRWGRLSGAGAPGSLSVPVTRGVRHVTKGVVNSAPRALSVLKRNWCKQPRLRHSPAMSRPTPSLIAPSRANATISAYLSPAHSGSGLGSPGRSSSRTERFPRGKSPSRLHCYSAPQPAQRGGRVPGVNHRDRGPVERGRFFLSQILTVARSAGWPYLTAADKAEAVFIEAAVN
jgi:hypothetical protein